MSPLDLELARLGLAEQYLALVAAHPPQGRGPHRLKPRDGRFVEARLGRPVVCEAQDHSLMVHQARPLGTLVVGLTAVSPGCLSLFGWRTYGGVTRGGSFLQMARQAAASVGLPWPTEPPLPGCTEGEGLVAVFQGLLGLGELLERACLSAGSSPSS